MKDLPLGFAMALSQNIGAMDYFTNLSYQQQEYIVKQIENINSQQEMHEFVERMRTVF